MKNTTQQVSANGVKNKTENVEGNAIIMEFSAYSVKQNFTIIRHQLIYENSFN